MIEKSEPLVTVVIPTYNQADYLRTALLSLQKQNYSNWEAIIINNFSSDHTLDVISSLADTRISVIPFRNHGIIAASRNIGISHANGRYIAFLDSDDFWYPEKLNRCVEILEAGVDWVSHPLMVHSLDGTTSGLTFVPREEHSIFSTLIHQGNTITLSSVVVRREVLIRMEGFSEDRRIVAAEDYDLWIRMAADGVSFKPIPETLGEYLVHTSNISNNIRKQAKAEICVVNNAYVTYIPYNCSMSFQRLKRVIFLFFFHLKRLIEASRYIDAILFCFDVPGCVFGRLK